MSIKKAENKTPFDWSGSMKGFMSGIALGSPLAISIIVLSLGITPQQAQKLVQEDPARAQQVIEQTPVDIIEQAQQEQQYFSQNEHSQEQGQEEKNPHNTGLVSAEQMVPFIAQWEGKRSHSYPDGDSRSVGFGFYLGNPQSRAEIENIGADYDEVFAGRQSLSEQQMSKLLEITSQRAINDALFAVPDLASHPQPVQVLIVDMAHTLGPTRLKNFTNMLKALKERNYDEVANEMQDSKWFSQTGQRGKNHVQKMKSFNF